MPALLLHDTGALFKVCRFMEVEGDVLFQIGRMKAGVCMSGKSPSKEGRPGELPAAAAPGALMFPLGSLIPHLKQ